MKNNVREYRKSLNITQLELANIVGISRQTVNLIEKGQFNPSLKLCINLATSLNTDLNSLFFTDNKL